MTQYSLSACRPLLRQFKAGFWRQDVSLDETYELSEFLRRQHRIKTWSDGVGRDRDERLRYKDALILPAYLSCNEARPRLHA